VVPAPNPTVQFTSLQSVDSRTDSDAWAVGDVSPPTGGPLQPLTLHWDGSTWSSSAVPQQGRGTQLWGVSASLADDAWAVGSFFVPGYRTVIQPTALHWNGTAWSPVGVPGSGNLFGVAALSPANAWAIGDTVKHWDGTAWSQVTTPSPNPSGVGPGSLSAISARTSADVWVVGSFALTRHIRASFSLHFDGTAWTLVPMPRARTRLWSVVAVGPDDAWAVGQLDGGTATQPVTEHWDGTAWSIVPSPSFASGGYLRSVTARGTGEVWAAGLTFSTEAGVAHTMSLRWNGTAWSAVATPPAGSATLWSVSARPGTSRIWAVGDNEPGVALIIERH